MSNGTSGYGPYKFARLMIRRRWLVAVACLVLLIAGIQAFRKLPIEPYPNVSPLNVQVITQWAGRSTLEVEQQLTIPIETALAGLPDVKAFRSISLFGLSVVTIQFTDSTTAFVARNNVIQYLGNASLPTGVNPNLSPNADALGEIMRYRIDAPGWDLTSVKTLQDWTIYKNLKTVPGIADVTAFGGRVKQYQVLPDPGRMQLYSVTLSQLMMAVGNGNGNSGGDVLNTGSQRVVVRGVGMLRTLDDVRNIVITTNNSVPVRVGDVAEVVTGFTPRLGLVAQNDKDDIVEAIVLMRRGGNASEVLGKVRERINEINATGLPNGVQITPFYDRQHLLDLTVDTVKHTLIVGIALVLLVLYAFLANFKGALIVAMVIPLGLCAAFIGMIQAGIPANLISLGAIDFGVIVDAAVIITENVMRHLEERGSRLKQSIILATSEVQRAMIYSTSIIIVAYSPLFLMGGVEGIIFKPMAFTMGFALVASIILSLTFLPAAISLVFGENFHHEPPKFITWMLSRYRPLLRKWMDHPRHVIAISILILGLTLISATRLGTAFLPTLEENNIWLRVTLPNTVDLDYSVKVANQLRAIFIKQPELEKVAVQIGRPDDGTDSTGVFNQEYGLYLKSPDEMPKGSSKHLLLEHLQAELSKIPGLNFSFSQYIQDNVNEALSGVKGENSVKIYGSDLDVLNEKAQEVVAQLKKVRGIEDENILKELGQPTLNVQIDRVAAARYGINVNDIQTVVANAIGGASVSNFLEDEKTFGIAIRLNEASRNDIPDVARLLIDTPNGQKVPLSMVANVQLTDGPFFIYREAGRRYIAVIFSVRGRDLGSAVEDAKYLVEQNVELPANYTISWDGQFNQMKAAQQKLMVIIPLTLLAIFLLLVAALGNIRDASIVLINVPFAAIGGIIALHLGGETLSISALFGFLSLFGIAIQDGVILISYINKTVAEEHGAMKDAMVDGAALRVRPVLMTAMLAGLGLLPAALSHSIGSEAQRPLALVIVGGMITTTVLTLLVLPVLYAWLRGRGKHAPGLV